MQPTQTLRSELATEYELTMNESKLGLSEGIVLAAMPVFGYWVAYLYELGFCKFFAIPAELIEIGIPIILAAILGIIFVMGFIQMTIDSIFFTLWARLPAQIRPTLLKVIAMMFIYCSLSLANNWSISTNTTIFSILFVPILFIDWILPLFTQRSIVGYLNKIHAAYQADLAIDQPTDKLLKIGGGQIGKLFLLCYVVSLMAYLAGGLEARLKNQFMVLYGPPERIVLKIYDQNLIAATFDRKLRQISNDFVVIPISKTPETFKVEMLGRLHL